MRLSFLVALLLASGSMLLAQDTPVFVTDSSVDGLNRSMEIENSDTLDNGNFVLLINQTSVAGFDEDVALYEIDRTTGAVVNRNVVALPGAQKGVGPVKVSGGNIWIAAETVNLRADNFTDVLLLELDANLNLINSYTYDLAPYEQVRAVGLSGEGSISIMTFTRTEKFGSDDIRLLTVSITDGVELTNVLLEEDVTVLVPESKLQTNNNGQILIYSILGNGFKFWGVDINSGEVNFSFDNLPVGTCLGEFTALPFIQNIAYNEAKSAFIVVTTCLDVVEISPDGSIDVRENTAGALNSPIPSFYRVLIEPTEAGLNVYARSNFYTLTDNGDTYQTEEVVVYPPNVRSPLGTLFDGVYLTYSSIADSSLGLQVVDVVNLTDSITITEEIPLSGTFRTNEHITIRGDELITMEITDEFDRALFYSLSGELIDSVNFSNQGKIGGVGVDGNENLVTVITGQSSLDDNTSQVSLIQFNRTEGIIDTLLQLPVNAQLGALITDLYTGGPAGEYYVKIDYFDRNTFNLNQRIVRIDLNGNIVYDYVFPQEYPFASHEPITVDNNGNVYFVRRNNDGLMVLISLDPMGDLRYETMFSTIQQHPDPENIEVNTEGTKVGVFSRRVAADGSLYGAFVEMDAMTGDSIREVIVSPSPTYFIEGIYQPETDNVLVLSSYFRGDDVAITESDALRFTIIDEAGEVTFQRDLIPAFYSIFNPRDLVVGDDFTLYAAGRKNAKERTEGFSTLGGNITSSLVGINFNEVVSVENYPDLNATASLKVFPNPTSDIVQITWDNTQSSSYELTLNTLDGRLVSRWAGQVAAGRATLDVDLSCLPMGTYVARLVTPNGNSTQRILKQ